MIASYAMQTTHRDWTCSPSLTHAWAICSFFSWMYTAPECESAAAIKHGARWHDMHLTDKLAGHRLHGTDAVAAGMHVAGKVVEPLQQHLAVLLVLAYAGGHA